MSTEEEIDYTSNPLLLGELGKEGSWNSSDDEKRNDDEENSADEDGNVISTLSKSDELSPDGFPPQPPNSILYPGESKFTSTWSPVGTQLGSLSLVPAPPSEKNKLTPLAVNKLLSKGDAGPFHKSLPKSIALEKHLDEKKKGHAPVSPALTLETNLVTSKNSFTSASILPPITVTPGNSRDNTPREPIEPLVSEVVKSKETTALPAIGSSLPNGGTEGKNTSQEADKACRELRKLYKKCKEKNEYNKMHDFVESIFKSFSSIAQYFKVTIPSADPYNESSDVNLQLLHTFCDIIDRFPFDNAIRKILLKNIVTLLMSPPSSITKSDLQAYFVMIHFPIFTEVNTYVVFSYLIRQISTLKPPNTHQLIQFFNKAGEVSIKIVAKMVRKFIDRRFFPPSDEALPPSKECSWWIPMACKTMAVLFASNVTSNKPPHVDYKQFYCKSMDSLELLEDYQSWSTGIPKRSFTFCQYSFVITNVAKRRLLNQASELEMIDAAKQNVVNKVKNNETATEKALFVDFKVRRTNLVEDSMKEIVDNQRDLKRKLRVSFVGEEGIDLGGLTKEWFLLMVRKVFSVDSGLFVKKPSRCIWPNGASKNQDGHFYFAGALLGLAIYNSVILDVRLPVCCFKKLLSPPLSPPRNHNVEVGFYNFAVYEYAELEPEVSKHLSDLLDYDGDVQKDFGLDFSVCMKESDGPKTYMLKKNGHKVKVSRENRREYVSRYIEFMMNQYISAAFIAFYKGFHSVCDSKVLTLLKAEELQSIICGEPHLDVRTLKKSTTYDGYSSKDEIIVHFWEVIEELKVRLQKLFLLFLTGCDKIPIGGSKDLRLEIKKSTASPNSLPVAHTCFNELLLPPYPNKSTLKDKLLFAIENTEGFALK